MRIHRQYSILLHLWMTLVMWLLNDKVLCILMPKIIISLTALSIQLMLYSLLILLYSDSLVMHIYFDLSWLTLSPCSTHQLVIWLISPSSVWSFIAGMMMKQSSAYFMIVLPSCLAFKLAIAHEKRTGLSPNPYMTPKLMPIRSLVSLL